MKPRKFFTEHESFILGSGFILLLLAVWESVPLWYTLPRGMALFFTTPSKIAAAFYEFLLNGTIEKHFYVSAIAFLVGLGLSIVVGLPLGLIMGRSRTLEDLLDPYITAANATPRIVFLPLLILWFGIGIWSKILIVFAGAVFPLLINTYVGVKERQSSIGQRGKILRRQRVAIDEDRRLAEFGALHHRRPEPRHRQSDTWGSGRRVLRLEPGAGLHDRVCGYELQSRCRLRRRRHLHGALGNPHSGRQTTGIPPGELAAGDGKELLKILDL